ncbi:TPT-domain-containing protein [Polychaeton citri CBS 116435]|uniref:TPT-domain-containing protein n=1 Tax=Polychaeton citri CBS 116435 TaxID=1314669 RepID=A0A9P4US12_9PEZI|nr:TPT-domain-containing protein [Polychaeton citri CBS 116435]
MASHLNGGIARRRSSSHQSTPDTFKFPDLVPDQVLDAEAEDNFSRGPSPNPLPHGLPTGLHSSERWPSRKNRSPSWRGAWVNGQSNGATRHGRQKSLSEAIRTVRTRKASVSENAAEIAEALKAPVSWRLITLCSVWYATSAFSNTSSKEILNALNMPTTLTIVQFGMVMMWCLIASWIAKHSATVRDNLPVLRNGLRRPTVDTFRATLPLTGFMVAGHILNYLGMAKIPVSLVHTIKGLSPLMTVFAYRVFFNIRYTPATYLSLIPLTIGVIMACAGDTHSKANIHGLMYAFASAIIFVTQNIVSKRIFNEATKAERDGTPFNRRKPDKLNLLCYSSATSFVLTIPIWFWSEGWTIAADFFSDSVIELSGKPGALDHGRLAVEFIVNGTFHFAQSLVAFVLLGMVSPVTYSVASLIKRVAVIMWAILWFHTPTNKAQAAGIGLTFLGLYLYDRTHSSSKADKRARHLGEASDRLLPLSTRDGKREDVNTIYTESPVNMERNTRNTTASGVPGENWMGESGSGGRNGYGWPTGTKANETWSSVDVSHNVR